MSHGPVQPWDSHDDLEISHKRLAGQVDKAIAALRRQGMRSLVLDLRGNPGGLLNVAVEIAERFIDKGVIVSTRVCSGTRAPSRS